MTEYMTQAENENITGPYIPENMLIEWDTFSLDPEKPVNLENWRASGVPVNFPANFNNIFEALKFAFFDHELPHLEIGFMDDGHGRIIDWRCHDGCQISFLSDWFALAPLELVMVGIMSGVSMTYSASRLPEGAADHQYKRSTEEAKEFRTHWIRTHSILAYCGLIELNENGGDFGFAPYSKPPFACPVDRVLDDLFQSPNMEGRENVAHCWERCENLMGFAQLNYLSTASFNNPFGQRKAPKSIKT